MPASHMRNVLRLTIILTFIAFAISIAADFLFKETLPRELAEFVRTRESADLSGREAAALVSLFIATLVGLFGLWWCKRWARLLFTVTAILGPVTWAFGLVHADMLVSNAVARGADDALSMLAGAIAAMTWFAMPEEFKRTAAPQSIAAAA